MAHLPSLQNQPRSKAAHAPPVTHTHPPYVSKGLSYLCRVGVLTEYSEANYDTANPPYIRKYLRTYGLTPPRAETYEVQKKRCTC